ncbi:hypothetical protein R70199_08174 [Paraburkholderia domus]|nr:hypothetical protein R70199_08174 [Paraburkholderia domus]
MPHDEVTEEHLRHRRFAQAETGLQPPKLLVGQDFEPRHADVRIAPDLVEQTAEAGGHVLGRLAVEQIDAVFQLAVQRVTAVDKGKGKTELALAADGRRFGGSLEAGHFEHWSRAGLHCQHRLEQGLAPRQPRWIKRLDDSLERQQVIGESIEARRAHPCEQGREIGVIAQVVTQHERVHEKTNQRLKRTVLASLGCRADRNVLARAEPMQQHRQRRLDHDEQGCALFSGEATEPQYAIGLDHEIDDAAGKGRVFRPRVIERQGDLVRQRIEPRTPIFALLRLGRAIEPCVLPQRIVGVLHAQRNEIWRSSTDPRCVGLPQVG